MLIWCKKHGAYKLASYANPICPACVEEAKEASKREKIDGLWCPRCGEIFHDKDVQEHPEEYHICPECGGIEHQKCRGPLPQALAKVEGK